MFKRNKGEFIDDLSIISDGMKVKGSIETIGNVRIDGSVQGNVAAGGNVTIGDSGVVEGDLKARSMTIGGKVFGSVHIQEKLILEEGSKLTGDIVARILVIEEGANYSGKCEMKTVAPRPEPVKETPEVPSRPEPKKDLRTLFGSKADA
jgi:cytoskeletal protein CcmA (bactofilin family)